MKLLNGIDILSITAYLGTLVFLGLYLKRRASRSIEDYFLGAKKLPWWALGVSGMSSFVDMAGTMLIVSFLYMLGPRGLYIEFRGGAVLILTFMLLWSGKWHYRSKCMTGAEWMEYRFGNSWGGHYARIISAFAAIITTIGMLAYMIKALGMFVAMFVPFSPATCALVMILIAAVYTIVSGFYGVVYTDLFQSLIIITAIIFISVLAITKINEFGNISELAQKVTGNSEWINSSLRWKVTMPNGYEAYDDLMLLAFFYFLRNMFMGISTSGADPRYFGARNERECGTLSYLWMSLMMFRWPMMMGFAVLGIFLVNSFFPDQSVLVQAADFIKMHLHNVSKERWHDIIANIMNYPGSYSPEFINGLKNILHENWQSKLHLLSYYGNINTEEIVPAVILFNFPMGVRGFFVIAFIASALSSFNSNVNATTAYFTRDLYQRYLRRKAGNKELIFASYVFIIFIVGLGYLLAYNVQSINQIWGWIIMGLGGGLAIPSMLKFYWWRYNGGGYAIGTSIGIVTAILQIEFFGGLSEWQQFVTVSLVSLIATIIGTYITEPTDPKVLDHFYSTTRPFGLWKPFKQKLLPEIRTKMELEHKHDLISVPFTLGWQVTLFLLPMQLMIQSYKAFFITLSIFLICMAGMYWFWYRNLPPKEENVVQAVE